MSRLFKSLPLLPLYDVHRDQIPLDGMAHPTPAFCKKTYGERCKKFYEGIKKEGIHTCPYGYSIRSFIMNGKLTFFSGVAVKGNYDHQKLKNGDRLPDIILSESFVEGCIRQLRQFQEIRRDYNDLRRVNNLFNETIHEIRNFNTQIKANCERVSVFQSSDPNLETKLRSLSQSNFAIAQMTTSRLNYLTFNINPTQSNRKQFNLYRKTDKVVKSIAAFAKTKQLKVSLNGSSPSDIDAFDFFELIPAVFIQNAVKYSLEASEVFVRVEQKDGNAILIVENLGPAILEHEKERIFQKGYRGQNAKLIEGTGQGLYFVKKIVEIHKGTIDLDVGSIYELNGNQIANIKFTISIPVRTT